MASESVWRTRARAAIQAALVVLPSGSRLDVRKRAIRNAYPFGERRGHPYKIWLSEQKKAFGSEFQTRVAFAGGKAEFRLLGGTPSALRPFPWISVYCPWCIPTGPPARACLVCGPLVDALRPWLERKDFLDLLRCARQNSKDATAIGVCGDWLADQGESDGLKEVFWAHYREKVQGVLTEKGEPDARIH